MNVFCNVPPTALFDDVDEQILVGKSVFFEVN